MDPARDLPVGAAPFIVTARTAVLATMGPAGRPRLVPICFVALLDGDEWPARVYSALDEKPKSVADPRELARVRDIEANPSVTLLVDRWSENWSELGWVRLEGRARLVEPGLGDAAGEHATAVSALLAKYEQYATHDLAARPLIRIDVERATSWGSVTG